MKHSIPFEESRFETNHSIRLHGADVHFQAIAEDYVFTDENGAPEASMFTYTYLRTGAPAEGRPVLFVWDGGPGSSCAQEHVGFYGPWRVKADPATGFLPLKAPYTLEENPNCPLDYTDLVLADPVGAGYGQLLNPEKASYYYSTVGDAEVFADFIEDWLTVHDRWNSPVYIAGTSYGTIRAARVIEKLNGGAFYKNSTMRSIAVNGVVLVGNCTWMRLGDVAADENSAASVLPAGVDATTLLMQSMAATNWYYNPALQSESVEQFMDRAWNWAWEKLEPVNTGKATATDEEKAALAEEMSAFIGIPAEMLLGMDLKLEMSEMYAAMRLAEQGKDIGIYDSRRTLVQSGSILMADAAADDPDMGVTTVAHVSVINGELKKKLGITFNRRFVECNFGANAAWNYDTPERVVPEIPKRDHNQCLAAALRRNETMKLLMACGAYDMCTWSGINRYTAENSGFAPDRTCYRIYPSGHAAFLGEEAGTAYAKDLKKMICG